MTTGFVHKSIDKRTFRRKLVGLQRSVWLRARKKGDRKHGWRYHQESDIPNESSSFSIFHLGGCCVETIVTLRSEWVMFVWFLEGECPTSFLQWKEECKYYRRAGWSYPSETYLVAKRVTNERFGYEVPYSVNISFTERQGLHHLNCSYLIPSSIERDMKVAYVLLRCCLRLVRLKLSHDAYSTSNDCKNQEYKEYCRTYA